MSKQYDVESLWEYLSQPSNQGERMVYPYQIRDGEAFMDFETLEIQCQINDTAYKIRIEEV